MYNAPRAEVELLCDNSVMDAIIDRFGPDVQTYAGDLQNFRVIEEIAVGKVFFNWIFGFCKFRDMKSICTEFPVHLHG